MCRTILVSPGFPKSMMQYRLFFVFLGASTLLFNCGWAQVIKPPILVGVGKGGEKQRVELSHVYATTRR
jgi:hypothetical protein